MTIKKPENICRLCLLVVCVYFMGAAWGILSFQDCASADFLFKSDEKTAPLVEKLDSFNPKERRNAAVSLKKLSQHNAEQEHGQPDETGDPQHLIARCHDMAMAIDALVNTATDIDPKVREASVEALGEYGKESLLLLASAFFQSGKNKKTAEILEKKKPIIMTELTRATRDEDRRVASAADKAIFSLKPSPVTPPRLVDAGAKTDGLKFVTPALNASPSSKEPDAAGDMNNTGTKDTPKPYSVSGYAESENYIGLDTNYTDSDGKEKPCPRKAEAHVKLNMTCGTESILLKTTVNGYGYMPGSGMTDPGYENTVIVPELYASYVKPGFDIQAGKQVIRWGTADTVNPTSYFNPYDLTENFLKDNDELFRGVYALAGKMLFNDYSFQAVITPGHTPALLPSSNSPWQLVFPNVTMGAITLPNKGIQTAETLDTSLNNTGCGLRFTGNGHEMDFSLSCYRGPDRDVILKPELVMDMTNPANAHIVMVPQYDIISSVGGDMAFTVSNITFQAEATWTKDKPAPTDYTRTGGTSFMEKTGFLFWDVGGTWISDNNCTVIVEYIDGSYTKDPNRYMTPLFSKLVSTTITKKILDDHLTIGLKGLYGTARKDSLLMPSLEWDFQNGFHIKLAGGIFSGPPDTLFGSYNERDIISLMVRYYF